MAKNKVVLQGGQPNLVDAEAIGIQTGYTPRYINRLADDGVIPWHGVRSGARAYRRYNPEDVLAALAHPVKAATNGNAQIADRSMDVPLVRRRRSARA
jgi:hypothetical protein